MSKSHLIRMTVAAWLGVWLGMWSSPGQTPLSNLVVTVATTTTYQGTNLSYVLIGSMEPQLLSGKTFQIFGKNGLPGSVGNYTLHGAIAQARDTSTVNNLLVQSISLGEDTNVLNGLLDTLLQNVPGEANQPLSWKVLQTFQLAATDPSTAALLSLVAHVNPALTLCAGQAFSEPITNTVTYEVREITPATGANGTVLGRVTITAGQPVILPAPGAPFQVKTNDPSDHLRIRLRWGTPDALRRLSLLSFGFNVWRMSVGAVSRNNIDVNNPTLPQLRAFGATVNPVPVIASKDFPTGAGPGSASDLTADWTTFFFADSNGHALGTAHFPVNAPADWPNGLPYPPPAYTNASFNECDQFYYFITARDVLGHDGIPSAGGLGTACRRLPPQPPTKVKVQNVMTNTQQNLLVTWQQDTNAADQVTQYWIYRWLNPAMVQTNDAARPTNNRVGIVNQLPNALGNSFLDSVANAPVAPSVTNFWYTVRSVSQPACTNCDDLLSPQSMRAWGVLRERSGPVGTTGQVLGSCGTPAVIFQNFNTITNPSADTANWNYVFTCVRRDPGIAWAQFSITNLTNGGLTLGPVYFPANGDEVQMTYAAPKSGPYVLTNVTCQVGTFYGLVSPPAVVDLTAQIPATTQTLETVFFSGELLLTSLSSGDPLLPALNGTNSDCRSPDSAKAYPDGTVGLQFHFVYGGPPQPSPPLMIQAFIGTNAFTARWEDIGVATPDSSNVYWVSYPACLLRPLPPFRGCLVNLGYGDCNDHVARGANNGPVAPIKILFHLTPRTHEYRLYRTVDDGPLSLIAPGAAIYDPLNTFQTLVRTDEAMPPSYSRLCYYVQLFDEHGNGGPMTLVGCKTVLPQSLPVPVMSQPQAVGDNTAPQVSLSWFCPTAGIYRFQMLIARADQSGSGQPTGLINHRFLVVHHNPAAHYSGLLREQRSLLTFDEAQETPPISATFGPGPKFTITADVVTNVPYVISISSEDASGDVSTPSAAWKFTWAPTNALPDVPWPARPLPSVQSFDQTNPPVATVPPVPGVFQPRVAAVLLRTLYGQLDAEYPVGIRIGDLSPLGGQLTANIGTSNFLTYTASYQITGHGADDTFGPSSLANPNNLAFRRASSNPTNNNESLLPIVVYRQQVANTNFPIVSGALTQVTPLIESLPYGATLCTNCYGGYASVVTIYDRLIAGGAELQNDNSWPFLYVRDQQPVILGAEYQYFVVRFNALHEISETIPAGTVTIP